MRARHGLEAVGDRDDRRGAADALATDTARVARSVPALMMVPDRAGPFAEERNQRAQHAAS